MKIYFQTMAPFTAPYYFHNQFLINQQEYTGETTADGDCSHEIKRCLLLGRKAMTNLDSVFKRTDITANKVQFFLYSQSYGFSSGHVWM